MTNPNNPSDRSAKHVGAVSPIDQLSEIDRYLLDDPSLDREAFELRMADDLELCERVAQAVEHLHLIRIAAKSADVISVAHVQPSVALPLRSDRSWFYAIAAIATAVLIGVYGFNSGQLSKNHSANEQSLAMIADSWLDASSESVDEAINSTGISAAESTVSTDIESETESSDWMFDAAREFYLENQNGAAG